MTALTRRRLALGLGAVLVVATGAAALYGTLPGLGNSAGICAGARAAARRAAPLARGEVAAVAVAAAPKPVPALAFTGPEGRPMSLSDFRGRTVLVNLWATWCVPCRQEMPALDRLQAKLGGPRFEVVAINIDTRNLDRPAAWLREAAIERLTYFSDPQATSFQELKRSGHAQGLPTSLVVDPQGCEIATINGPADWASEDALALIRAAAGI
jgi:thiol-disulfide isomerase/thioredoxin